MLFPVGSLPPGPPIETKKALLLLDFQNDFVSPTGKLPVSNVHSFLSKLPLLAREFRAKGEVVWCGSEFIKPASSISATTGSHCIVQRQSLNPLSDGDESHFNLIYPHSPRQGLSPSSSVCDTIPDLEAFLGLNSCPASHRCCTQGSVGIEYPELLQAAIDHQQDLVLLKSNYSAFVDTPLLVHLRTNLVTELYVCGSISNISVYATVLDAVCHGLQVYVIEDCLGYNNEKCHIEAMRQMADNMGANGVDYQELRDDLAGLLGDVVHEEEFSTKFQLTLPPPSRVKKSHDIVHDWFSRSESNPADIEVAEEEDDDDDDDGNLSNYEEQVVTQSHNPNLKSESSFRKETKPTSKGQSPPRKRSTSDLDPSDQERLPKLSHKPSTRVSRSSVLAEKVGKQDPPLLKGRPSSSNSSAGTTFYSAPDPDQQTTTGMTVGKADEPLESETLQGPELSLEEQNSHQKHTIMNPKLNKKKKKHPANPILGPGDTIGQGDSLLYIDLLDPERANAAFYACKRSIKWQKMFHRSGEVPRLVAVQGLITGDGTEVPIYRHPADESPELLQFDSVVDDLRRAAEKVVHHPLNHALIQWYRNSEDNISEHSDKSLDIVRGSKIVNLSLGARRTMILRTKRSAVPSNSAALPEETLRPSQRIPLPHNSLFILGPETNQHWLHAIRADKRPTNEKDPEEVAFDGERISLTFRHIGTFVNPVEKTIWGQGATNKTKSSAKPLKMGSDAEREGEMMIRAFGQENHRSTDWEWETWYGDGFDVINFETRPS